MYLAEIGASRLLNAEEEIVLAQRVQKGIRLPARR
jgi:hypothetical protein